MNYNTTYFNRECTEAKKLRMIGDDEGAIVHLLTSIAKSLSAIADVMEEEAGIKYEEDDDEDSDD